jgi:SAM-dependent methyltransferase
MKLNIINRIDEIYQGVISLLIYILLKPFVKILYFTLKPRPYHKICFIILGLINYLFPLTLWRQRRIKKLKADFRRYRDTYDRKGINLYFKLISPERLLKDKVVLDLGCGTGGKTLELLRFNPRKVIGIDPSQRNISYARELVENGNRDRISFSTQDILEFENGDYFDSIVTFTVFEHIVRNQVEANLIKMYEILKPGGNAVIVFNHYNDRFGSHLKEYVYHPWPQTIFNDSILSEYWNYKNKRRKNQNENTYYPKNYNQGIGHNADCYMGLNKISISDFERILLKTNFNYLDKYLYSKSILLKIIPFLPSKYLIGSAVYLLRK